MSTCSEIRDSLLMANLTEAELLELNKLTITLLKDQRAHQARVTRRHLYTGARVQWEGGLSQGRGRRRIKVTKTGVVESVKRKYAHVKDDSSWQTWRVPISMLTVVEG